MSLTSEDASADEVALKRDLVIACRVLAANGHGDNILGHVSARLPGWDRFWMKGAGLGLDEVTEADLLLLDFDGNVLDGTRRRHEEYPIHAEIMRAHPDALAVLHTHPKFGIAFAARGLELRPVSHEGAYFWPPGVPTFTEFTDLVRTRAQGEAVVRALADAKAIFLLSHGVAVRGPNVAEATVAAIILERAAEIQLLAQPSADAPLRHTSAEESLRKGGAIYPPRARAIFEYYARRLAR